MLRIPCPYCGVRDQDEFRFGGEADVVRPAPDRQTSLDDWADYLYYRTNRKGLHRERWLHRHGCRQWFELERNTLTHEIVGSYELCAVTEDDGRDVNPHGHG